MPISTGINSSVQFASPCIPLYRNPRDPVPHFRVNLAEPRDLAFQPSEVGALVVG